MHSAKTSPKQYSDRARNVWSLMAKDFYWSCDALSELRVGVRSPVGSALAEEVKLQVFEVVVAALFAQLRPDYNWWVTPNRPDGGVDFIGRGTFLTSKELGIDAAITIGGQCKKRERVTDVVSELSGSFVRMAQTLHPTLFVAAFSAPLTAQRIADAKLILEHSLQRHCHILDRYQLEALIGANLAAAKPIIERALNQDDSDYVIRYFQEQPASKPALIVHASAPSSVLAGEPFRVRIQISRSSISEDLYSFKWAPALQQSAGTLVAPLGADSRDGIAIKFQLAGIQDPFTINVDLEFLLYAIGLQPLGTVTIHFTAAEDAEVITVTQLPAIDVVENLRPRFYDVPYREPLDELERALLRARSGKVTCVAVIGAGGSGKTRLCEEMCLEARRQAAHVVSARQAHSTEFPRRIIANLLLALAESDSLNETPTNRIDDVLSRLEPSLANRARYAIEALWGQAGKPGSFDDDQSLLSVLAVLIAQRSRSQPLVIHLHDLHWCTLDVLETIDRLIWQLDHLKIRISPDAPSSGICVLFLLEGRKHEYREDAETGWSTRVFEKFIGRLGCPVARCRAFEDHESATFARRIFEQAHSTNRMLPRPLLRLQDQLISAVYRVAGGNPLHMLEQVKLLQQHGILAQNPQTGLIFMIRPEFSHVPLPSTVLETIEARWRYYWLNDSRIAVLLWAVALVDDNLPAPLFRHLWRRIAPESTWTRIESTEFLRFPQQDEGGLPVSFRHENYYQTVRRIQLPESDRRIVVEAYDEWFCKEKKLSPALRYFQAKIGLEASSPDLNRVRRILRSAQAGAEKLHDRSLIARILATLLDGITWPSHQRRPLSPIDLIKTCDAEVTLCKILARSGQTSAAHERIQHVLGIIELYSRSTRAASFLESIWKRKFVLLAMEAQILFQDRQPAEALAITDRAVEELNGLVAGATSDERQKWNNVLMEVCHTHSVAVALDGDLKRALVEARRAASIAEGLVETSPYALDTIITYANILLCEAPEESESILERYLVFAEGRPIRSDTLLRLNLNLSMARIVLGYREQGSSEQNSSRRLASAHDVLMSVFRQAHPLGRLADAAAAALLLGLVRALWGKPDEIEWFSQAISLAVRARQLETLWRAYINLAHSLSRSGQSPHDPAAAALDLMIYSLRSYAEPDRTLRFNLLSVPMAHAVRYLILAGDREAEKVLRRFPALRRIFASLESGRLKDDRDGRTSHEWLRIGTADYVIY